MEVKEKQADTILNFIYTKDENENLNKLFESVQLEYANITLYFKDLNFFSLNIELKQNCFYYLEIFNIKTKKNTFINTEYYIYAHKKNNIYIDVPEKDQTDKDINLMSLQILYQSIDNKLLPSFINYGNNKLKWFDLFQNTLRKRISLINIDTNKLPLINEILKQYPETDFQQENSYEIYVRIPPDGDIKYSGVNLEMVNCNRLKNNKLDSGKIIIIDKKKVLDSLNLFKNEVFKSFINNINKMKPFNAQKKKFINEKINYFYEKYKVFEYEALYYYDNILKYDNFEEDDIDIFVEIFYYLTFIQIFENSKDSEEKKEKEKKEKEKINEEKNEIRKKITEDIEKHINKR